MMDSRPVFTIIFIAICAYSIRASAQNGLNFAPSSRVCVAATALVNTDLFGDWSLLLEGGGSSVVTRLQLRRNPEYAESLAGSYRLGDSAREVFGDIEEGAFDLEESANGKDKSASIVLFPNGDNIGLSTCTSLWIHPRNVVRGAADHGGWREPDKMPRRSWLEMGCRHHPHTLGFFWLPITAVLHNKHPLSFVEVSFCYPQSRINVVGVGCATIL